MALNRPLSQRDLFVACCVDFNMQDQARQVHVRPRDSGQCDSCRRTPTTCNATMASCRQEVQGTKKGAVTIEDIKYDEETASMAAPGMAAPSMAAPSLAEAEAKDDSSSSLSSSSSASRAIARRQVLQGVLDNLEVLNEIHDADCCPTCNRLTARQLNLSCSM